MDGRPIVRQLHRVLALAFTFGVIIGFATWECGYREAWVGFLAIAPLTCLLVTGLYMLVSPYLAKVRNRTRTRLA